MIIWADYVSQGHDDEMDTLLLQFCHIPTIADDYGRLWFFTIQLEPSPFFCFSSLFFCFFVKGILQSFQIGAVIFNIDYLLSTPRPLACLTNTVGWGGFVSELGIPYQKVNFTSSPWTINGIFIKTSRVPCRPKSGSLSTRSLSSVCACTIKAPPSVLILIWTFDAGFFLTLLIWTWVPYLRAITTVSYQMTWL